MANTFNRLLASGTSAGSTLKTMPASTSWVVIGITVANVSGSLLTIDVAVAGTSLAQDVPIPDGATLNLLEGKLVLVAGDTLTEKCSVDAGVDYIISYMEIT